MQGMASVLALALLLTAPQASIGSGGEKRTLVGDFDSGYQDRRKRLEAVFTPAGSGIWEVDFHFEFNGRRHTYSGTAEGSLSEGELAGEVQNESRSRTFTFRGEFENGVFSSTHAEVLRGRESKTGTMTLR